MLAPMADDIGGLEQRKLLYGLSAGNTDPTNVVEASEMQAPLPGASEGTIIPVTGGEQAQYADAYRALVMKGADKRFPAQMKTLSAAIDAGNWAVAAKQLAALQKAVALPATTVRTATPPPVAKPADKKIADKKAGLLMIGGMLALGAAAMYLVSKSSDESE